MEETKKSFDRMIDEFLADFWVTHPTLATAHGVHGHDGLLEDMSRGALEGEALRLGRFHERVQQSIPAAHLDRDRRVDRQILLDQIEAMILELRDIRSWERDPSFYLDLIGNALLSLMRRPFAPAEVRAQSLLLRMAEVSRLLGEARANLARPARIFTETAIRLIPGTIRFLTQDLPRSLEGIPPPLKNRLGEEAARAVASLLRYEEYLRNDLLPLSTGDYRLGGDLYREKFRLVLGTDLRPEELLRRAREALRETQEEMVTLAGRIDPRSTLGEVLEAASRRHPAPEGFLRAFRQSVVALREFIRSRDLSDLPDPDRLRIEPAPPFFAIQGAFCDSPGPFESHLSTYLYVSQFDGFSAEEVEGLLRDDNDFVIPIVTIHEAYPGHFVHFACQNRCSRLVPKVFWNGAFVEGWAHYAEQMMVEAGFGEEDPRFRLFLLKNQTRSELNAILDILLHTGQISEEAAVGMLQAEGWQPEIVARKKVERAALTSVQLSSYFLGRDGILDLRKSFRRKMGGSYTLKGFHNALLSLGSPPLPLAREMLLEEDG